MREQFIKKSKGNGFLPEYRKEDLGKGVRGKHLKAYQTGTNLVLLDPKLAAAFPTERAVNEALNGLIEVAEHVGLVCGVRDEYINTPSSSRDGWPRSPQNVK